MATRAVKKKPVTPRAAGAALSRAARDKQIVAARVAGKTIREIAEEFSLSVGRVHAVLARERGALIEDTRELAGEYRAKQLEQLGEIVEKWLPRVKAADAGAPELQALIKALAHEAALVGAFSATKTEVTGADGGALKVEQKVDLSGLSLEELQTLESLSRKVGGA